MALSKNGQQCSCGEIGRQLQIVLDLDSTDFAIHGRQEGRFFDGFYDHYCYLPLYIFCENQLLCARLRQSNIDASAGSLDEIQRIPMADPINV